MTIIILEKVPSSLKGELGKWMIEIAVGTFIGVISAMVRNKLWEKCIYNCNGGRVTMAWKTNNEQGFDFKNHNENRLQPIDVEGVRLMLKVSNSA